MKLKLMILTLCLLLFNACSNETLPSQAENHSKTQEFRTNELSRPIRSPASNEFGAAPAPQSDELNHDADKQETAIASFSFQSVKWNDRLYKLIDEELSETEVELDHAIGEIKHYSNVEQANIPNDYSNYLREGTQLWAIKGMNTSDAIAVKNEDGRYSKLIVASSNE